MTEANRFVSDTALGAVVSALKRDGYAIVENTVGSTFRGGGANRSGAARSGLALHYALGWLRFKVSSTTAVGRRYFNLAPVAQRASAPREEE